MKDRTKKIFYLGGKNFQTGNVLQVYPSVKPVEYQFIRHWMMSKIYLLESHVLRI
ncbi:MAG: hypothetical protein V7K21_09960 [Nostoc sp.]|uniref:hypothetical protein n=1 Tax=Nostoc sp. TaxID=1180 RepID=UPI002FF9B144